MRAPTTVSDPDVKAITVFLASTATPERGALPYLDALLPAGDRLAAARVVRDLGALPPDAILYRLAQPLLTLRVITSYGTATSRRVTRNASRSRTATSGRPPWRNTIARPTRSPPPSFANMGSRGWRTSTSRTDAPSTAGWSAAGNTSSGRRPARTPPICGRRASSTDPSPGCAKARSAQGALQPFSPVIQPVG